MKRFASICAAVAAMACFRGSFAAEGAVRVIEPSAFIVKGAEACKVTMEEREVSGEKRAGIALEIPFKKDAAVEIEIPLGGIDMLNDWPTVDY